MPYTCSFPLAGNSDFCEVCVSSKYIKAVMNIPETRSSLIRMCMVWVLFNMCMTANVYYGNLATLLQGLSVHAVEPVYYSSHHIINYFGSPLYT